MIAKAGGVDDDTPTAMSRTLTLQVWVNSWGGEENLEGRGLKIDLFFFPSTSSLVVDPQILLHCPNVSLEAVAP